ncbi:LGFP repeat-containing protein, partial [Arthrobacter sp. MDB2-24]
SVLGYPVGNEICGLRDGGCYQSFQKGEILWSSTTGARITANGPIRTTYRQNGAEHGTFGYPTSNQTCPTSTKCTQTFQHGTLTWTPTTGVKRT